MLIKYGTFFCKYIPDQGPTSTIHFDSQEAMDVGRTLPAAISTKLAYLCPGRLFSVTDLMLFTKVYGEEFQCAVTARFMSNWLTITMDASTSGLIVMVDGKPLNHPDNENIDLSCITVSAMNATKEQIEMMHKENKERYANENT